MAADRRKPPRGAGTRHTRPAQRAGAAARPKAVEQAPRGRITNRAVVLLVVLAVLAVSYASSMRAYLQQRSDINELKAQIAASKEGIAAAEREKARWEDPTFVAQQARERFGWVLPGETAYQVLDENGEPLAKTGELTDPASLEKKEPKAWWTPVERSFEAADHPERTIRPKPASSIGPGSAGE